MTTNFNLLLEAFNNVANAVKGAANLPGVNLLPYASTVANAIDTIQAAIALGKNVTANIISIRDTFSDGLPSEEKLAALDAEIAALRARIHAPLPPKEEGEED
jgi:hypothetical protein